MVDVRETQRGKHAAEGMLENIHVEEGERQIVASKGPQREMVGELNFSSHMVPLL